MGSIPGKTIGIVGKRHIDSDSWEKVEEGIINARDMADAVPQLLENIYVGKGVYLFLYGQAMKVQVLEMEEKNIKKYKVQAISEPTSDMPKGNLKGTVKDSVFCDLFEDRKYALQLYKAIHPEDEDVTEADIEDVTINNVFTDQEYNDLGMTVRGRLLLMLEAQSTWSMNIIVRILLYLAHTWNQYIESTRQNRYSSTRMALPRPELYMLYVGERRSRPEWICLSDEFFEGDRDYLEVKVRVLYGEGKEDIISQYVDFTKVYNEQLKKQGMTKEAVLETIRICKDRNVLREYLSRREKEVVDIMMALFDQQKAVEQFGYEKKEEGREEGRKEGKREVALNMKAEGMADSVIARILGEGLDIVQEWLAGKPVARP